MKVLGKDDILDSHPLHLTSQHHPHLLLTVSGDEVTFEGKNPSLSQKWKFILNKSDNKSFLMVSEREGMMVCHNPSDEGFIHLRKYYPEEGESSSEGDSGRSSKKDSETLGGDILECHLWRLGSSGEIYQDNPKGGEKYLWVADGKLYVTLDGYLAENWIPIKEGEEVKIEKFKFPTFEKFSVREEEEKKKKSSKSCGCQKNTRWIILVALLISIFVIYIIVYHSKYLIKNFKLW